MPALLYSIFIPKSYFPYLGEVNFTPFFHRSQRFQPKKITNKIIDKYTLGSGACSVFSDEGLDEGLDEGIGVLEVFIPLGVLTGTGALGGFLIGV